MMASNIRINGQRLWDSLMQMAAIGATAKGGVCRLALTDLDRQGRDLFVTGAEAAGCTVAIDAMGNIFARRPGRRADAPAIGAGSHLDTQPTGGKFDGAYGVLAALEVVRTLDDYKYETEAPIEIVVWTNEEGSRFAPAMVGSGVFAGAFDLAYGLSRADPEGTTLGDALARIGYAGSEPPGSRAFGAFFECHIEQGPILEAEGKAIGIVQGVQGIRWYDVTVTGQEAHAGPTPMARRKDALLGAARLVEAVNRIGLEHQPQACATVGVLQNSPNSRNTIPGRTVFSIDFRHPLEAALGRMDRAIRAAAAMVAADSGLEIEVQEIWYSPPVAFDPECIAAVHGAADRLGLAAMPIVSGAGHDSVYMARVAPTGMIFVPCAGGISHNETESATPDDLAAGCNVLLQAILERATAGA
jgi:N-carbamoyl-L-amino-acid hydrolase